MDQHEWSELVIAVMPSEAHAPSVGHFLEKRCSQVQAQVDLINIVQKGDVETVRRLDEAASVLQSNQRNQLVHVMCSPSTNVRQADGGLKMYDSGVMVNTAPSTGQRPEQGLVTTTGL